MTTTAVEAAAAPVIAFTYASLDAIADAAAVALLALWRLRFDFDDEEWLEVAAYLLARHVVSAQAWGRLQAALDLSPDRADPVFYPDPPEPDEELPRRLVEAWRTVLDVSEDRPDPEATVERLARDEPVQAAQVGYQEGLAEGEVTGYRRRINPDACELCRWLRKDGYVYPIEKRMHRHTGCRCLPEPTTDPVGRNRP